MSVPSRSASSDAEIVRLLREQDPAGLRLLLSNHAPAVHSLLARKLGSVLDDTEIEDALNEAAYNAWRASKTFDEARGTLRAWFYKISHNAALGIVREKRRAPHSEDAQRLEGMAAAPTEPAVEIPRPAISVALAKCVAKLPRVQRKIIQADLACGDVADAASLAKQLNTSKNSIYVSRSIARKKIREALERDGHAPLEAEESS